MTDRNRETKTYWRSLERLLDSPALQPEAGAEFPDGASTPPTEVDRRTVMRLMGASFAMAGLTACRRPEENIVPYVTSPEHAVPGVPLRYATTLALGTDVAGVVVETHDGRPTKVEGNELHSASGGAADSWTQAAILDLYDPDRSRRPRRRDADGAVEATWEEFENSWNERAAAFDASGGSSLAVLAEESASPTAARLAAALRAKYPAMRWVSWEPVSDRNIFAGLRMATGQSLRPRHRLDAARVTVALDADLLQTESGAVANARGFAAGRQPGDSMNRLYAIESRLSLTGANADHRWGVPSRSIGAIVAALASRLGVAGVSGGGQAPAAVQSHLDALAADLRRAGSRALLVAGRHQPPEVHAAVFAINQALGAVGTTLELYPPRDVLSSPVEELGRLATALQSGEVDTLVVLGGNPAYTGPVESGLAAAIEQVAFSVHLSGRVDETSSRTTWHLPASHAFESWHDTRHVDGTAAIGQPLIAPLFDSRSTVQVLGVLLNGTAADAYQEVRTTWGDILGQGDFERRWNQALHDGFLASGDAPVAPAGAASVRLPAAGGDGLELVVFPSPSVYDGRFANNGWLQELPDPISKITWDNALHISTADADREGLASGDVVTVTAGDTGVEVPVWVSPGQAPGSVALEMGFNRSSAGRVGDGVGANAFEVAATAAAGGVTLAPAGRTHQLVQTQEHWSMEGRSLVREATVGEYQADPEFATRPDEFKVDPLWAEHDYTSGYQWGMTIDLNSCTGCSACIVACQSENNIPVVGREQVNRGREMHWLRVDRYYTGSPENPSSVVFQPIPCMHCENAPCEQVCPVAATVHDAEGINAMVYNRCIGTRYCSNNCPYKVRRFNFFNLTVDTPETLQLAYNPDVTVRSRGVMEKCSFCLQRISEARIRAKSENREITDGEIRTACQQTCPSDAIVFGNINDPDSRVSRLKASNRNYTLLAELYNKPRTSFLARVKNPNPALTGEEPRRG